MTLAYDVSLACRVLVATVFAVSSITKVRNRSAWRSFSSWLAGLPVPALSAAGAPAILTAAEAAVVVLVVSPGLAQAGLALDTARFGLAAATALCLALLAGLSLAVRRGAREPCHCFGASSEPLGFQHIIRNALLVLVAAAGSVCAAVGGNAASGAQAGLTVIGGFCAALLLVFWVDISALVIPPVGQVIPPAGAQPGGARIRHQG